MDYKWCCQQLGLDPCIRPHTKADLRAAFKRMALMHHPDRVDAGPDRDAHEERFKHVANAYQLLTEQVTENSHPAQPQGTGAEHQEHPPQTEEERAASNPTSNEGCGWYRVGGRSMRNPYELFEEEFTELSSEAALSQIMFDVRWATVPRAPPVVSRLSVSLAEIYTGVVKQVTPNPNPNVQDLGQYSKAGEGRGALECALLGQDARRN